jgi:peroxiredoxin (alkyl hydroperoxide reductase subunit C)
MIRASVGKSAPDFTATAVMDGKLKGNLTLD